MLKSGVFQRSGWLIRSRTFEALTRDILGDEARDWATAWGWESEPRKVPGTGDLAWTGRKVISREEGSPEDPEHFVLWTSF